MRNGHILTTVFGRCEGERRGRVSRMEGGGSSEAGHTTLNPITGTAVEVCGAARVHASFGSRSGAKRDCPYC